MKPFFPALALLAFAGALPARAASPGDEVIVVYNTRWAESKTIAQHYAERRGVPSAQIFGFALSTTEEMSRGEFRDALQKPLAKAIAEKNLWRIAPQTVPATTNQPARVERKVAESKIRYAVLCYGIPTRITRDNSLKENGDEKLRPEMRRNEAAVDNELALLPAIEQQVPLAGPLRNPLYGVTNAALLDPTNNVLIVARLDGPSAAIARDLVDKALEAERDGLWGRAYFDLRKVVDPGFKLGDDWIRNAAEVCKLSGFETVVDENYGTFPVGFPMSQIAIYMGWYSEHVCGPFTLPKVEFMPGAFAYHLHSFSASNLRSPTRNWAGPLLARGATATMGCVDEPYLGGTPDVATFAARFIFYGFTFGEAAYAAQSVLSWQTTVVGDPLYRPFSRHPGQIHNELEQRHSKLIDWSYLRLINLNLVGHKPLGDVVTLLEQFESTNHSAVLSEKLGDLYAAQGKPSSAAHAWAKALSLDTSHQQRIRLMLTLAEKLSELARDQEAYDIYQSFNRDFPDYPDNNLIYKKLLALAQKLNKKTDAEKYQAKLKL